MQANNISVTQKGEVHGLKNTAVHELNQIRAEALNDIDELEGGFSCVVASLSLSLSPSSPVHCGIHEWMQMQNPEAETGVVV